MDTWMRDSLPREVSECILSNFDINGALPLTRQDVKALMESLEARILLALKDTSTHPYQQPSMPSQQNAIACEPGNMSWTWGGRIHMVPEGFRFPHQNIHVKALWDLWWFGNKAQRIAPYRLLKSFDFVASADKNYFSKAKNVVQALIDRATQLGLTNHQSLAALDIAEMDEIFKKSFLSLVSSVGTNISAPDGESSSRIGDISYLTLYDRIKKPNRQPRNH
jgi:hypothetical protein